MTSMSALIKAVSDTSEVVRKVQGSAEKLFAVFDEAIEAGDLELAEASLRLIEVAIMLRPDGSPAKQLAMDELVMGHKQLWMLRHPEALAA